MFPYRCVLQGWLPLFLGLAACQEAHRSPPATMEAGVSPASGAVTIDGGLDTSPIPSCAEDPSAPTTTWGSPRRTMPWKWIPASMPAPGSGGQASVADGGVEAGAQPTACGAAGTGFGEEDCSGEVLVARDGAALSLTFPGGSVLRWDSSQVTAPVAPPALAHGERPWVRFTSELAQVCPFCGSYYNRTLEIRERSGGPLLWVGREGHSLDDVSPVLIRELFGVTVREQAGCQSSVDDQCWRVDRQTFDHLIETTPARLVRHAALERLSTPGGTWDVVWALATEPRMPLHRCVDGPALARDVGFAASRIFAP